MSKNPYPTHYKDQPNAPDGYDKNVHGAQGGPENLPDQKQDAADELTDGAKGWTGDQSVFK